MDCKECKQKIKTLDISNQTYYCDDCEITWQYNHGSLDVYEEDYKE